MTSATARAIIIGGIVILVYVFFYTTARRGDNSFRHCFENLKKNLKMREKRIPSFRGKRTMDAEKLLDEALDGKGQGGKFSK